MSTLFRQEALRHQSEGEIGEALRVVPISHTAFTLFLASIVTLAIGYLSTAGYSRKETVLGLVTPSRGVIRVIAPRAGTLTELLVNEGDVVQEDQVLFRVVTEETNAAGMGSDTVILDAIKQQRAILEDQIRNETAHAHSEAARLEALVTGLGGEVTQLESQRKFQAERARVAREFYSKIAPYTEKGLIAGTELQNRLQTALTEEQSLASLDERLSAKRGELRQAQLNLERAPLDEADRLANLQRTLSDVTQHVAEIEGRRLYIVRAPIAGRVTSVLGAVGRTVDPRIPQLSIVPADSNLEAELFVPARAIGFIAKGQHVRLLYDAFPFERFGTYAGTVESVATAMLAPSEMPDALAALKEPAYRVKVALDRQTVDAFGHEVGLQPDMTLRADVILEKRAMLEWLLEPLLSARQRMS